MKKLLIIPLLLFCVTAFGQWTKPQLYENINTNIRLKTFSATRLSAVLDSIVVSMGLGSGGSGYVVGPASATDNVFPLFDGTTGKLLKNSTFSSTDAANAVTAYGWGNHAGLYRPIGYVPSWSEITSKPTTIAGYGITDFNSLGDARWVKLNGTSTIGASGITLDGSGTRVFSASNLLNFDFSSADGSGFSGGNGSGLQIYSNGVLGIYPAFDTSIEFGVGNIAYMTSPSTGYGVTGIIGNLRLQTGGTEIPLTFTSTVTPTGLTDYGQFWVNTSGRLVNFIKPIAYTDELVTKALTVPTGSENGKSIRYNGSTWEYYTPASPVTSIVGITGTTAQFNSALTDNDFATLTGSETITNKTFTTGNKFRGITTTQSGTSYTVQSSDEGTTIQFANGSTITVTLPDGLATNFNCSIEKWGNGDVVIVAATSLVPASTTLTTQYTGAYVEHMGSNAWKALGAFGSGGGSGDVVGPSSSFDNGIVRYDGTTGKLIQNSSFFIDDTGDATVGIDAGTERTFNAESSGAAAGFVFNAKGGAYPIIGQNGSDRVYVGYSGIYTSWLGAGSPFEVKTSNQSGSTNSTRVRIGSGAVATGTAGDVDVETGTISGGVQGTVNIQRNASGKLGFFNATGVVKQSAVTTAQGIADVLTAYGLLPSSTISGGSGISDGGDATNADFTASVNTVYNLPAATLSTNRTITIPAGSDMDVIEIYNEEAGFTWNLTGSTVYQSDGTTAVTSLLAQTNYVIRKVSGKWKIKN